MPKGNFKLYPFFLLAIVTGARFGELLNIDKKRDINLETNINEMVKKTPKKATTLVVVGF